MQMLCRNRVADFETWKAVFDSHAGAHRTAGLKLVRFWRSVEDPNEVFFLFDVESLEKAQQFIKDCWGRMVRHGAWATWEFFVDNASWCHAWATSPTHYLSTEILGVSFPEPGDRNVVRVEPRPGSLTWAAGTYPHPDGPIRVRWEVKGGCLLLEIEAPEAVEVQVNEEACIP